MLRLMLLRHAKADPPGGTDDSARALSRRGREESRWIGRYMADEGLVPDLAIVSTARRAQETWELASPAFVERITHHDEPSLYMATANAVLKLARQAGSGTRTLLLVGHNPGLEDLALKLVGLTNEPDLAQLRRKFPTAGLAVIDFEAETWPEIARGRGRLERFTTPKSLEGLHGARRGE